MCGQHGLLTVGEAQVCAGLITLVTSQDPKKHNDRLIADSEQTMAAGRGERDLLFFLLCDPMMEQRPVWVASCSMMKQV